MHTGRWIGKLLLYAALAMPALCAAAEQLVIDYVVSTGGQRTAWVHIIDQFTAAHPAIKVVSNEFTQEQYKRNFTTRLKTEKVDLAFWFAGERLHDAVKRKLLSPLDAGQLAFLLKKEFAPATLEGTRIDGQVYGFPLSYYAWGFIYRKSLFDRLGLRPPATWSEFLNVCKRLKAAGVTPLAVGAKSGWPAAGWFDYLNLRINGIEFHRRLLRGDERFTDPRVRKVFDVWGDLLRKGYFLEATMDLDWDRVPPYLYRDQVGMMLMGTFVGSRFPATIAADMGFFAFPRFAPGVPQYEEAPLDVLVLPANGANRRARKLFLAFLAESGALQQRSEINQTVSPQGGSHALPGSLSHTTHAILNRAAGLTFFFDRDAKEALIEPTFDGLRQFLKPPHDTDQTVRAIDRALHQ
jgi:multiple sugar transport system substrate-binding protein